MSKKKAKKKKKVKKKVGVDKCGRREGTQGYLINTKITDKPKTVEALCKETKLPKRRITTHVYHMTKLGFFKKSAKGYCWK